MAGTVSPAGSAGGSDGWPIDEPLLVTGAAGFIGARFVRSCLARGIPVIAVDHSAHFTNRPEHRPLSEMTIDRDQLFDWLRSAAPHLRAIVHLGACTNTLETDETYLTEMNTEYSKRLWDYATLTKRPFLYANHVHRDDDRPHRPLLHAGGRGVAGTAQPSARTAVTREEEES